MGEPEVYLQGLLTCCTLSFFLWTYLDIYCQRIHMANIAKATHAQSP